jgi:CBS domain-containing protein
MRLDPSLRVDLWKGPARPGADGRFEAVREQHAATGAAPRRGRDLVRALEYECRHGERRSASECTECAQYLNLAPDRDLRGGTLRCIFFDDDPVHVLMTPVVNLVTVNADASMTEAAAIAETNGLKQLPVVRGDELVGIVRVDEGNPLDPIARAMRTPVRAVPALTPLAAVARLFRTEDVGSLVVMDADDVAGLVTRGDLRRAGVPQRLLARGSQLHLVRSKP